MFVKSVWMTVHAQVILTALFAPISDVSVGAADCKSHY